MTDKKELAEQILRKHIGEIDWPEFKEFGFLRKATAAIIEAMGVQPGMSECDTNKDFLPNCNFGYSYHNIKTENDDVTYFLRNLAWGKNDEFKYALKQLVLRLRKIEELLNNEQNVQVSDTRNDAQRYTAD